MSRIGNIQITEEGSKLDMNNMVFYPGLDGYAVRRGKEIYIPVIVSRKEGVFSNLLKELEDLINKGYVIKFSNVVNPILCSILLNHGYKLHFEKWKELNCSVSIYQKPKEANYVN